MLHKTRAIVLRQLNYNDNYGIVRVFTEEFGLVSYLTRPTRGKKAKGVGSVLHPLAILNLEVEHQPLRDIQRLKEARVHLSTLSLLNNPIKSTVSLFLAEWISKAVQGEQTDKLLFDYLVQSIQILDLSEREFANFHLVFLMRLTQFLGFHPAADSYVLNSYFDLLNGLFVTAPPNHVHYLDREESALFFQLLNLDYTRMGDLQLSGSRRKLLIGRLLEYYRLHLATFPDIKSLEVLHEVFG
ncbi:DNA repair protein RecO [Candidatus Symbiothrix dinenymphae]|nr:DNA repair protein RecO [Candidatus Symbiothrix dinenymphae]